ncbi:MAG: IS256 family transposase [Chloroflexi bacterium OHK40]
MAAPTVALLEDLRKLALELAPTFLREALSRVLHDLMEFEVQQQIGAKRHERSPERTTYRNGTREREWQTRVGAIPLQIPRLRSGSYFPSFLEPRRRAERALINVIQEAYVEGVSTRKVDDRVRALGLDGIDKSAVSRICQSLDEVVTAFCTRPLEGNYPYLWLDALYLKVRQNERIVSMAVVIAVGVLASGERRVLGVEVGASEDAAFWTSLLRSLVARGLRGVELVISDAHEGLKQAIASVLTGASWQRCRVHTMRNILAHVPQKDKAMVAAAIRTIFVRPTQAAARSQLHEVVQTLQRAWPKAAAVLLAAADDILAHMAFPSSHWSRIDSTNPLERLNREVKRRTDVVGVFPNEAAALRLVGAVLLEIDDEWQVERRYFSQASMERRKELTEPNELLPAPDKPVAPIR